MSFYLFGLYLTLKYLFKHIDLDHMLCYVISTSGVNLN